MAIISSITKGPRESNFELLRIIAMLLVLIVHTDYWALSSPNKEAIIDTPLNVFTK